MARNAFDHTATEPGLNTVPIRNHPENETAREAPGPLDFQTNAERRNAGAHPRIT